MPSSTASSTVEAGGGGRGAGGSNINNPSNGDVLGTVAAGGVVSAMGAARLIPTSGVVAAGPQRASASVFGTAAAGGGQDGRSRGDAVGVAAVGAAHGGGGGTGMRVDQDGLVDAVASRVSEVKGRQSFEAKRNDCLVFDFFL